MAATARRMAIAEFRIAVLPSIPQWTAANHPIDAAWEAR